MQKNTSSKYNIKSIGRATDVLLILNEGIGRITDISKELRLPTSAVHRILTTLEASGFVAQDPVSRQYHLGSMIIKIASNPRNSHLSLVSSAMEEMKRLWEISEETVSLDILINTQRILLHEIASKHTLRMTEEGRFFMPVCAGSVWKMLLSQLSDDELSAVLKVMNLTPLTPNTICNIDTLKNEIINIRAQGYSSSCGERIIGAFGISVPIRNYLYPIALSLSGPESRLKKSAMGLIKEMRERADIISRKIQALGR